MANVVQGEDLDKWNISSKMGTVSFQGKENVIIFLPFLMKLKYFEAQTSIFILPHNIYTLFNHLMSESSQPYEKQATISTKQVRGQDSWGHKTEATTSISHVKGHDTQGHRSGGLVHISIRCGHAHLPTWRPWRITWPSVWHAHCPSVWWRQDLWRLEEMPDFTGSPVSRAQGRGVSEYKSGGRFIDDSCTDINTDWHFTRVYKGHCYVI